MKFNKIYIEITNYCNLNCSFCSKDNRIKHEMTIEEFKHIVNEIEDYTDSIYLHVKGEPLLHTNLDEILSICDENNLKVRITTNGTLLEKKKDILLNHNIKQINISLHSENNQPNYFETVFNTCDELSKKTAIVYRIWTLSNLKLDKISTKIVDKITRHYNLPTDIVNKIINDKNIKISDNIYLDKDFEFEWPKIKEDKKTIGTCLGTRTHIAILSNGDVVPCCLDSNAVIKLGNLHQDTLQDIINSDLFQNIRTGFQNNKVICSLCQSCTYRLRFDTKNSNTIKML